MKVALRKTVRQQVGPWMRQEPHTAPGHAGVLTVTGLCPSPLRPQEETTAPDSQRQASSVVPTAPASEADAIITQLLRHPRYLLTLQGRPPLRLAGIETSERLEHVAHLSLDWLAARYDARLAQLYQGLQSALAPFAQPYQAFQHGAAWLRDIAYILEPAVSQSLRGEQVAEQLRGYLDTVRRWSASTPM